MQQHLLICIILFIFSIGIAFNFIHGASQLLILIRSLHYVYLVSNKLYYENRGKPLQMIGACGTNGY